MKLDIKELDNRYLGYVLETNYLNNHKDYWELVAKPWSHRNLNISQISGWALYANLLRNLMPGINKKLGFI